MRAEAEMRDAQQRVATHLYEHDAVQAILGMGAGKTCAGMTAAKELIEDGHVRCAVVLAPKRVAQLVWTKEHKQWEHLQHLRVSLVTGTPAQRRRKLLEVEADIYSVGIDNLQWLVELLETLPADHKLRDLLIVDESSRFKNPRGKRAKALLKTQMAAPFRTVWELTGTPRPNGYEDQWMPLSILTRGKLWGKSFDRWRQQRFMPLDYNEFDWSIRPEWRERTIADISTVTITIPDSEMPDLPPLVPVFHWVELPSAVRAIYKEMERHYVAEHFEDGVVVAANAAVSSGKLCQVAQGFMYDQVPGGEREIRWLHDEKSDELAELVDSMNGNPVMIAYEFEEDLDRLKRMYPGLPWLGKGTKDKQAEKNEADWNARRLPQLALHPASAGHGLNLQYGGNQFIWYGLTWSAELYDQTIKRFHRPGQTERCFVHHILARDTLDEVKYDRVVNKMSEQDAFRQYIKKV